MDYSEPPPARRQADAPTGIINRARIIPVRRIWEETLQVPLQFVSLPT
jgi:hypothetical protein